MGGRFGRRRTGADDGAQDRVRPQRHYEDRREDQASGVTARELEALAKAAGEQGTAVYVLAYCGLRWGEMAALRVRAVDLLRGRLVIEEAVTEVDGALVWGAPKDHQRRTVPVPAFLRSLLEQTIEGKSAHDLVFVTSRGAVMRVRGARRAWFDEAAAIIGGLTPHELRHTAASLAVSAGASVLGVQRLMGHEKASMTLDVCADLFDHDLDDVATRLDEVRAAGLRTMCGLGPTRRVSESSSEARISLVQKAIS